MGITFDSDSNLIDGWVISSDEIQVLSQPHFPDLYYEPRHSSGAVFFYPLILR